MGKRKKYVKVVEYPKLDEEDKLNLKFILVSLFIGFISGLAVLGGITKIYQGNIFGYPEFTYGLILILATPMIISFFYWKDKKEYWVE